MPLAQHPPVNFPVLVEPLLAPSMPREFAQHVLGVVPVARVRHGTGTLDWLPTQRGRAQRIVRFVVMVRTQWLAI
jgi:hypothetical protein